MIRATSVSAAAVVGLTALAAAAALDVRPAPQEAERPVVAKPVERIAVEPVELIAVEEARGRARLLHDAYESTLHVIHRRYFDADEKDAIPARALEDVFKSVDEANGTTTRWIAVNTPPMNVDHAPREGFETDAAAALGEGRTEFEAVEGETYRRAGAVRLFASCLKCHESGLTKQIRKERVAALVIRLPLRTD